MNTMTWLNQTKCGSYKDASIFFAQMIPGKYHKKLNTKYAGTSYKTGFKNTNKYINSLKNE